MKIMIVVDDRRMRNLIKEIIKDELDIVELFYECGDGMEAVEVYEKLHPDWVLMDIEMDRMNGITASKKILTDDPKAKIM